MLIATHLIGFGSVATLDSGGNDAYTTLLLHCDGADTSTTFTDSSASAHSLTTTGNAQIDTDQSKFGGASGLFDGTGDYIGKTSDTAWDFGSGDFTIDLWIRPNSTTIANGRAILDIGGFSFLSLRVQDSTTGNGVQVYLGGSIVLSTATALSSGTWYHVAISRSGTTVRLFLDGSVVDTQTNSTSLSGELRIGRVVSGAAGSDWNGWLEEVRISKGIARWTGSFTPSASAYS